MHKRYLNKKKSWIKVEWIEDFNVIHMDRPEVMPPALFVEEATIGCF